ncbi:MAG: hypothetical protein HND52_05305 [Ignavibacteriae bacterium]|nr:hypothetical protein [Ignavibacteriota bacterium]NOG97369.1 hypothetical protein [Ignavibacteriota bacterium]
MKKSSISFEAIKIRPRHGKQIYGIYYVKIGNKVPVKSAFSKLDKDTQDLIKVLITNLATMEHFESPKILYKLKKGMTYHEIRPGKHRFFFFQKCGKNYIFFDYVLNKTSKLKEEFYKELEKKKAIYEEEFERFKSGN